MYDAVVDGPRRSYRQSLLAVAISAVLAGTPEIVQLYNHGGLQGVLGTKARSSSAMRSHRDGGSSGGGSGVGREDAAPAGERTVRLQVEGLRCAACGARLKQALLAHAEGVSDCTVDFASGAVAVRGHALREHGLIDTVQRLGYSASVVDHHCEPGSSELSQEL